jgi:hypothetical protein
VEESILCWFEGVFSTSDQKVQLVAIVSSTLIAIFVLLVNQRLVRRTVRNELMLSKYELAYNHTVQLNAVMVKVCSSDLNITPDKKENLELLLITHAKELNGLCALYFSNIHFDIELFNTLIGSVHLNKNLPDLCDLEESLNKIKVNLELMQTEILREIVQYK